MNYKEEVLDCIEYTEYMNGTENHYYLPIVYTLYGKDHTVLYVGSTQGIRNRLMWHSSRSYWDDIEQIGIRIYPDREQMRIAELAQMFIKSPKYNRDGKYRDDKECLIFGIPGIKFSDETEEVIFERDELYEGKCSEKLTEFFSGRERSAPDRQRDQLENAKKDERKDERS